MKELLDNYFKNELTINMGIPTVTYLAQNFNLSPNYLSDMLRSLTGQSAQQHIHDRLLEMAKEKLRTGQLPSYTFKGKFFSNSQM